jgi:hypothetical protein
MYKFGIGHFASQNGSNCGSNSGILFICKWNSALKLFHAVSMNSVRNMEISPSFFEGRAVVRGHVRTSAHMDLEIIEMWGSVPVSLRLLSLSWL